MKAYISYFLVLISLIIGWGILFNVNADYEYQLRENNNARLHQAHQDAITKLNAKIDVYATIVSGIRSFVRHSEEFPDAEKMQSFLHELVREIEFNDSLTVSFVNREQIFQYSVTPYLIDPAKLTGLDVTSIRPKKEIDMLDSLMNFTENISLFPPINLIEGYPAFPFNFTAINRSDSILGYIAPVLSTGYLLDNIIDHSGSYDFYHRFSIGGAPFTRNLVYDEHYISIPEKDEDLIDNFTDNGFTILFTPIDFNGLPLVVETRYKSLPSSETIYRELVYLLIIIILLVSILAIFQIVRDKKHLSKLKEANEKIQNKSKQNEEDLIKIQALIKEIHHRVKNNLQIISSLLNLQSEESNDENVINALQTCRTRVQSMALVHRKLYGENEENEIMLKDYVLNLVENVNNSFSNQTFIRYKTNIDDNIFFNLDTSIPFGLMLNELLTNSYKYAFIGKQEGLITINVVEIGSMILFEYSDNGIGFNQDDVPTGSFGLELVRMLIEQLRGELEFSSNHDGVSYKIKFQKASPK